jgi:hypothetical protein
VTVIVGVVVGLTFCFGFGNVFALGLRLGVPVWVAPLVAPAVDLSVVGLLVGSRQLAVNGGPVEVLRSARRLLIFASVVTLALNIAEPLIAGYYGKAAFDAVGPLLLIGWSEVAPDLLDAMRVPASGPILPTACATDGPPPAEVQSRAATLSSVVEPRVDRTTVDGSLSREVVREAHGQDLLHRARAEDVLHWQQHQRPISAETLRKRLAVGTPTARGLVTQLRADTHSALDRQEDQAASS